MSSISSPSDMPANHSRLTLRQFVWDLTLRRVLRNLLFLSLAFLVALVNTSIAVATIGLSTLLIAAPFRYQEMNTNFELFLSPVDTMPEAIAVGIAGAALLVFSILLLIFIGEIELSAARQLLKDS